MNLKSGIAKWILTRSFVLYGVVMMVFWMTVDFKKAAHQRTRYLLGVFYNETLSNFQDGIVYFDYLSHRRPEEGKNYFFLGYCYLYLGQYDKALVYFERALKMTPDEPLYRQYLAHVKAKVNKTGQDVPLPQGALTIPLE